MELLKAERYKKEIPPEQMEAVRYDFSQLSPEEKALVMKARRGEDLTEEEEDALPYEEFCRYLSTAGGSFKKTSSWTGYVWSTSPPLFSDHLTAQCWPRWGPR